ncbi:MAG: response regulator [Pirellulaceae bacterium]|nr:response regulator [Pirellulaceae bacterium]
MTNFLRFRNRRSRYLTVILIAVIGGALSFTAFGFLRSNQREFVRTEVQAEASQRIRALENRFSNDVRAIYQLSSFVSESVPGTRADFNRVAQRAVERFPDLKAVMWVPRIRPDRRSLHEEQMQRQGFPEYQIRILDGDGQFVAAEPRAERGDYFPLQFLWPAEVDTSLLGVDLETVPDLQPTLQQSLETNQIVVSLPWEFPHQADKEMMLLVVRSVFHDLNPSDTPQTVLEKLVGFFVMAIGIDAMLDDTLGAYSPNFHVQLFDMSTSKGWEFVCAYDADDRRTWFLPLDSRKTQRAAGLIQTAVLDVPGRTWTLECVPGEKYLEEREGELPMVTLIFGLVLTGLATFYANTLLGQQAKVERLVVQRTAELQESNERLKCEMADRTRAEDALRDSEWRFRSLVETTNDWIWEVDADGIMTYSSPRVEELLGFEPAEILGKPRVDLLDLSQQSSASQNFRQAAEQQRPMMAVEQTFRHRDGRAVVMETNAAPILAADGKFAGYRGISRNITARKQTEEDFAYERFLLNTLLDHSPDFIYFKDAASRYIRISRALADYVGLAKASDAIGRSDSDFFDFQRARQYLEDERRVMASGRSVVNKEEEQEWPDGRVNWVSTTKVPLRDQHGQVIGTFGISRDITDRKQAEAAMQAAREAAEAASRAKSDFLANMSHEIRTPLNAILGMTELVLDTRLTDSQRDYLKMVLVSSESLLSVINDILDFAKIEAGKLDLVPSVFDLRESLGDAVRAFAFRAHAKGLELACRIHPDTPDRLIGDIGRLRQVVNNLLSNAIKFTERGEVVVQVEPQSLQADSVELLVTVSDTGIGIPAEKQRLVFAAFEQADTSSTRRFGGTGLGLTISSHLAEYMGGRLWVESEVDRGSHFRFTARFGLARDDKQLPSSPSARISGTRVLVVDDNATNRQILSEMLRNWGIRVTVAEDARQALVALQTARQQGDPFALVLNDACMPDIDGFNLAEKIREDQHLGGTIIMMLTSGDRPGDIQRCGNLNIGTYLLKPIKQSELFDALMSELGVTSAEDEPSQGSADQENATVHGPLRVLLAEDSLFNQKLAVGLLERRGHSVVVAQHGREALAAIEQNSFDLVLMDIQMPEMDGLEATRAIRARELDCGGHLPIIAMTAHAMKGDRERCLEAGMDAYVAKPVRAKDLFDAIDQLLRSAGISRDQSA